MQSVYFKTYGCALNKADAKLAEAMLSKDMQVTNSEEDADLVVVSTCAVKEATENKILHYLGQLEKKGKKVIVSGCLPKVNLQAVQKAAPNALAYLGPNEIKRIPGIVNNGNGLQTIALQGKFSEKFDLPMLKSNVEIIQQIQISSGCLSSCTFCATKLARGAFESKPIDLVAKEVEFAVANGTKEIQLASQDTGCYGFDLQSNTAKLMQRVDLIPGEFFARVGMGNPRHFKTFSKELLNSFALPKIYKFLHIPIQSGSNSVLERMQRNCTAEEFVQLVEQFKAAFPESTVETDIIVGFPGETTTEFEETVKMLEKVKINMVNVSKFSSRIGTKAAKMEKVNNRIVKQRSTEISELCRRIAKEINYEWIGWTGEAIVMEKGKHNSWIARNSAYKQLVFNSGRDMLGKKVQLKAISAEISHLKCDRLD